MNLSNGGLTVVHAAVVALPQNAGGLLRPARVYNSKNPAAVWGGPEEERDGFVGKDWLLTYGRVFLRTRLHGRLDLTGYDARALYFYLDETGTEHRLYWQAKLTDTSSPSLENYTGPGDHPSSRWYFTNDSSFIRAKYDLDSNTWSIYYPDGSVRVAGDKLESPIGPHSSYIPPIASEAHLNSDGTEYYTVTNPQSNGWYVTRLRTRFQAEDREDVIRVTYLPFDPPSQPYPGFIQTVTDAFDREITFEPWQPGGRLKTITGAGVSEEYGYDASGRLVSVTNSAQDQITYSYDSESGLLASIGYPTGATSSYNFGQYTFLSCVWPANPNVADCFEQSYGMGVTSHALAIRVQDPAYPLTSAVNTLTWTYNRNFQPDRYLQTLAPIARTHKCHPVTVTDPLGVQETHFFTVADSPFHEGELSPGKEIAVIRYAPGVTANPSNPAAGRVHERHVYFGRYDWLAETYPTQLWRGDAHNCFEDSSLGIAVVYQGNPRVWKTVEQEFDSGSSTAKWTRTLIQQGWDGFGHYCVASTGTGETVITQYDLKKEKDASPLLYQLDRAVAVWKGRMSDTLSTGLLLLLGASNSRR